MPDPNTTSFRNIYVEIEILKGAHRSTTHLTASIRTVSDRHSFYSLLMYGRVGPTQFYIECVVSVSTEVEID